MASEHQVKMGHQAFLNHSTHQKSLKADRFSLLQISTKCGQSEMIEKKGYTNTRVSSSNCTENLQLENNLHRKDLESHSSGITFSLINPIQSPRRHYNRTHGRACSCQVLLKLCIPATPVPVKDTVQWRYQGSSSEAQRFPHFQMKTENY